MIRKTGNIILALLVLCTTTGIVVNQHYSGGELYSSSAYTDPVSCCDSEEEEKASTCHEESKVYKVKDYFRASPSVNVHIYFTSIIQTFDITELFDTTAPVMKYAYYEVNLLKPKIPKPEFLQVFIL
ncbi:MAG: HYC_CC_PP family protein [Bacteroidota bacterium]